MLTVTVSPDTVKSPVTTKSPDVVTVTSVASPIVTLSVIWGSLAVKLAILTSMSVFVVNVKLLCRYDCNTLTSILLTVPASLIINSSVLAKPDANSPCPEIISSFNIPWWTASAAIVVALLTDVTSPVKFPILVTVPALPLVLPVTLPVISPAKPVAVKIPVAELNVKLSPLFGPRLPVAAVANNGKHVVSEDSSATVTVVAIAAVPVVDAAISSVCVVTNVCIWSAVAKPVPLSAIAAVTILKAGAGPPEFATVNWLVVADVTPVMSPDIIFHPPSYTLTSELSLSYHIVPVPGSDGAVPDVWSFAFNNWFSLRSILCKKGIPAIVFLFNYNMLFPLYYLEKLLLSCYRQYGLRFHTLVRH